MRAREGTFLAGQLAVASTSVTTICIRTMPLVGFSRSAGKGSGPGLELQSDRALTKFPIMTDLFFTVLSCLESSAIAVDPKSAKAISPASAILYRLITKASSERVYYINGIDRAV